MFNDLIQDNPECELRLPSSRQGSEMVCIRCEKLKGVMSFTVAAWPTKRGVCRACCSQEERLSALTLGNWRGVSQVGKTTASKMFERKEEEPQQARCPRCHQSAFSGLQNSVLKPGEKVCYSCHEGEMRTIRDAK